jgi:hypothetical protein
LLDSGKLHDAGHVSAGGRDAIRLASEDGSVALLVARDTYEPIEWRVSQDGQTAVARFPTYERLPADDASTKLLDLKAQHPEAALDENSADYAAARQRLWFKIR